MSNVEGLLEQHGTPVKDVYLDWENGSIVDKEVLEAMTPIYLEKTFGNPAITHKMGWETYDFYVKAKTKIAEPITRFNGQLAYLEAWLNTIIRPTRGSDNNDPNGTRDQ